MYLLTSILYAFIFQFLVAVLILNFDWHPQLKTCSLWACVFPGFPVAFYFVLPDWLLSHIARTVHPGLWLWSFPFEGKHISVIKICCRHCKFCITYLQYVPYTFHFRVACRVFIAIWNWEYFFHHVSLSGWHQKFSVMSHQMKSRMYTALV